MSSTEVRSDVLVIGGSAGIGLKTARLAREEGADVNITARDHDRLHRAGLELGASIAAFDSTEAARLELFFRELPGPRRPRARLGWARRGGRSRALPTSTRWSHQRAPARRLPPSSRAVRPTTITVPPAASAGLGIHGRAAGPVVAPAKGPASPGQGTGQGYPTGATGLAAIDSLREMHGITAACRAPQEAGPAAIPEEGRP